MTFRIDQSLFNEDGDWDNEILVDYIDSLMTLFGDSPEAAEFRTSYGDVGWTTVMVEYGVSYLGTSPASMTASDLSEIVFSIFPRKVSCEPESAAEIVAELRAFWKFVKRAYGLSSADACLELLSGDAVERLEQELADQTNYGIAKSFFMLGSKMGFDMGSQSGLDAFTLVYNASLLASQAESHPSRLQGDLIDSPTKAKRDPIKARRKRKLAKQSRKRNRRKK